MLIYCSKSGLFVINMRSIKISDLTSFGESYISFCNLLYVFSHSNYTALHVKMQTNSPVSSDDHFSSHIVTLEASVVFLPMYHIVCDVITALSGLHLLSQHKGCYKGQLCSYVP